MANSVKLLNWVDPDGDFIKFYSELNSEFDINDKVFVAGGPYDNTMLAQTDPFHQYATGYTVLAIDKTNLSNSITLNIKHQDVVFQKDDEATLFNPVDPYYTMSDIQYINSLKLKNVDDLTDDEKIALEKDNYSNEAWISKSHFKKGEFNGGIYQDGIFGKYETKDSTGLDMPVDDFDIFFNRKNENNNAVWTGGIFLGGIWQWGEWNTRYPQNKYGKVQELNSLGGIKDPLDESKLLITEFNNNFNGVSWNMVISGNFGRVWTGELNLKFDEINNLILFDFIPFELRRALLTGFNVQLQIDILDSLNDIRNNRKYTIKFDPTSSIDLNNLDLNILVVFERIFFSIGTSTHIFIPAKIDVIIADPEQLLLDDVSSLISLYNEAKQTNDFLNFNTFLFDKQLKNVEPFKNQKFNRFSTGRFQDGDWFNGLWLNEERWQIGDFQGGDWWNGELKFGRIGSSYKQTRWHDGFVNGVTEFTNLTDLFWNNGILLNGTWDGARKFVVESLIKRTDSTTDIQLNIEWASMFTVGDTILMSYFKGPNSQLYLQNWSNDINQTLLEFQTFEINNIIINENNNRVLLNIDLDLSGLLVQQTVENIFGEQVLDLNYQFARISNSYFNKGIWIDGNWNSGYFNGNLDVVEDLIFDPNSPDTLIIKTIHVDNIKLGDFIELTNVKIIHLFDFTELLPGTNLDDRNLVEFWQNLDQALEIIDINTFNNTISLDLTTLNSGLEEESEIIGIHPFNVNSILGWTNQVWENSKFNTGVWENGAWKNGVVNNIFVENPNNTQIKVVWRSGVWKNGEWNNGVFLSGIWEDGVWNDGFMTNGWKRSNKFWNHSTSWQQSDSVWMNGTWNNGRWIRGMWNDGTFINGTIENSGIDKTEIISGNYTNGREDLNGNIIFSDELTSNNSYGAAPSLVFIDSEGWIQLDQASWYQKDYNVIIKDLNSPNSDGFPWNDQMFDILDRDDTGARIKISISGDSDISATSGTNGDACKFLLLGDTDIPQDQIDTSLPIAVVRNIVGIVEIQDNIFWVADGFGRVVDPVTSESSLLRGYNRILEIDSTLENSKLKLIQKVLNNTSDFNLVYDDILKIETDPDSLYVYTLEATLIRRINKQTLEYNVVINLEDLQTNSFINLITWYNFALFPARTDIPETIFIYSSVQENQENKFNIITVFPNGEFEPTLLYYSDITQTRFNVDSNLLNAAEYTSTSDFRLRFNHWMEKMADVDATFIDVKFKNFSLSTSLSIFQKLPIDIEFVTNAAGTLIDSQLKPDGTAETVYRSNSIHTELIDYSQGKWSMQTFNSNLTYNILNSGLDSEQDNRISLDFFFTDYAVQPAGGNSITMWMLQDTRKDIFLNIDFALTPLLKDIHLNVKSIDAGQTVLVAILTDNISPLIIPQEIRRIGLGVSDINPGIIIGTDLIQYKQKTLGHIFSSVNQNALEYWRWDYPTNRLILINETNENFYDIEDEYGIEPPKFDEILFINKKAQIGRLVYFEKRAGNNVIKTFDSIQRTTIEVNTGDVLGSFNSASTFVDAYYLDEQMYILYYTEIANIRTYYYDKQSLISSTSYANILIPNTPGGYNIIQPHTIIATTEQHLDITGINRNKVYVSNDTVLVFLNFPRIIFKAQSNETIVDAATISTGNLNIMFIATKLNGIYQIYRLTKNGITIDLNQWPTVIDSANFTRTSNSIVYQTTSEIYSMKSSLDNESFVGLEIATRDGFILLDSDYISTEIKGLTALTEHTENIIDQITGAVTTEVVKYAFDSSNRILRYRETPISGTNGVNIINYDVEYGQYLQALEFDSYIRNATSMHYINWQSASIGEFIIFVDERIEELYSNDPIPILEGYQNTKVYVRALKIEQSLNNSIDAQIVTMFDGLKDIKNLKDPFGNIIDTSTSGFDLSGDYLVVDIWATSSNITASIYMLVLDNVSLLYQLILMEISSSGNTTVDVFDIGFSFNIHLTGFNVSRQNENDIDNDVYYLNGLTSIYILTLDKTGINPPIITEISTVPAIISDVVVMFDRVTSNARDFLFIQSIKTITEEGTSGTSGTAGVQSITHLDTIVDTLSNIISTKVKRKDIALDILRSTNMFRTADRIINPPIDGSPIPQIDTFTLDSNINNFDFVSTFNTYTETALFVDSYTHGNIPTVPTVAIEDSSQPELFQNMNTITFNYDETSLLVGTDFDIYTLKLNIPIFDGIPSNVNFNIISTDSVVSGTEQYNATEYQQTSIPSFKTLFEGKPLFNGYYKETSEGQLISPHVNGRVLYKSIWRGSQWNSGSDTRNLGYTAHLVSSTWLGGDFTGSWDTPDFFNHTVLQSESKFIDGVFGAATNDSISGVWNDGLFLGGRWVSGQFKKGHFISEQEIIIDSIDFPGASDSFIRVNQVVNAQYDFSCNLFRLDLEHFYWDEIQQQYIRSESRLVRNSLIKVPGLFQDWKLLIREIRNTKYPIQGQNEIVLITDLPDFDIPNDWLVGSLIYLQGFVEYTEYLHGTHLVVDSFIYGNSFWVTIISDFNKFNENDIYTIDNVKLPYISLDPFKILHVTKENDISSIWFDVPLPPGNRSEQIKFLKDSLIISSLDIITEITAPAFGTVVSPEHVQVFDRSANGGPSSIQINRAQSIQGMLFDNVDTINYTGVNNISDIILIESNLTQSNSTRIIDSTNLTMQDWINNVYVTNITIYNIGDIVTLTQPNPAESYTYNGNTTSTISDWNVGPFIENSLIYSGSTTLSIKQSGWLNQDNSGFSNAVSTFSGQIFTGDWSRITGFFYDTNESFLWLELERALTGISENQFIFLRGFSGNKSRLIGSSFSKTFRIHEIDANKVKISNPFALYNVENIGEDTLYRTKFNIGELILYQKSMLLEKNSQFVFFYSYASNSAWNGGEFKGLDNQLVPSNFNSVWNAGKFNSNVANTSFTGEWFGTPDSYYWTGTVDVIVEQKEVNFELIIDLDDNNIIFGENDLVYVEFLNNIPEPFYSRIENNRLKHEYSIFYQEGKYIVTLIRYRAISESNNLDQLILDQNLDIGPEDNSDFHTVFNNKVFKYGDENTVLSFAPDSTGTNGILSYNISYISKASSAQSIIFDMWVRKNNITGGEHTIISFIQSDTLTSRVVLTQTSVEIRYQLNLDPTENIPFDDINNEYVSVKHLLNTSWNHLYVEYLNDLKLTKIVLNAVDIIVIDNTNSILVNTGNWMFNVQGSLLGIPFDKNYVQNILIGQGNTQAKVSYRGNVDLIRFWNRALNDGININPEYEISNEIEYIKEKRFISYSVKEIDAKVTFDLREEEFANILQPNAIILSEVEFVDNIELPPNFLITAEIDIEVLQDEIQIFRFTENSVENVITAKRVNDEVFLKFNNTILINVPQSERIQIFISKDKIIIDPTKTIPSDEVFVINLSNTLAALSLGNSSEITLLTSIIKYYNVTVYSQNDDVFINNLIIGNHKNITINDIFRTVNLQNISTVSDNFLLYPPTSGYPTLQSSTDPTNPGFALQPDLTGQRVWTYWTGDSILNVTASDSNGSNIEIWGTSGQPDLVFYTSEIFQLDPSGNPVWAIDNVSWKSSFESGQYKSNLWRAGELKGGNIINSNFIWKWGINSGGNIVDE